LGGKLGALFAGVADAELQKGFDGKTTILRLSTSRLPARIVLEGQDVGR
jgi:hypothetical protein